MTINERMERAQWDTFWIPADVRVVDRDELLYLHCERPLFYLNQVLRTRAAPERLPALFAEVGAAHAHTTSSWSVFDTFDRAPLERALAAAGYDMGPESDAMVLDVGELRASPENHMRVAWVEDATAMRHSVAIMETAFGHAQEHPDAEIEELLAGCTGPDARTVRFLAYDRHERPVSTGCMHLYPDLDLGYLWGGSTAADARGQGAYSALLAARVAFARSRGIGTVGVYAIVDTSAPILERRGFSRCGYMTKWRTPGPRDARVSNPAADE